MVQKRYRTELNTEWKIPRKNTEIVSTGKDVDEWHPDGCNLWSGEGKVQVLKMP